MIRLRQLVAALAVWSLALGVAPQVAVAGSPDAKIDQQIRPCFGLLLDPNLSAGCRTKHYRKPRPRYGSGYGYGYGRGGRYRTSSTATGLSGRGQRRCWSGSMKATP
jgi:hypothetical protein